MVAKYAAGTEVSASRSRDEIERTLQRYGADEFVYGTRSQQAVIGFRIRNLQVKMLLPLPDRESEEFTLTPGKGLARSNTAATAAWEQACRQRWRALALVIKAKLEAVEVGISTIEREFLADTVLPDGSTVGDWVAPQLDRIYLEGIMPPMLPGLPAPRDG